MSPIVISCHHLALCHPLAPSFTFCCLVQLSVPHPCHFLPLTICHLPLHLVTWSCTLFPPSVISDPVLSSVAYPHFKLPALMYVTLSPLIAQISPLGTCTHHIC